MADRIQTPEFRYTDGELRAEDVPVSRIAAEVGTPFYLYSRAALERNYRDYATALSKLPATICYALKANSNLAVIRVLARLGAGADVVSEGETRRALAAGIPADRIVFSGVGKTRAEMAAALEAGVLQINIESEPELDLLHETAQSLERTAAVAVRINPHVDAATHEKIATGQKGSKFGIDHDRVPAVYRRAAELPGIDPVGLAVHIGSQVFDLAPFRETFARLAALTERLRADGLEVRRLDLGGGVGIAYRDETPLDKRAYAGLIEELIAPLGCEILFEPGRSIAGDAGLLVAETLYVKQAGDRRIVVVDAAMNDLKRPAMYGAYHAIVPVAAPADDAGVAPADVVGPVCESGDTFAIDRPLPPVDTGALLAFATAGAYAAVMASSYNSRLLVPEVLVDGERFAVVRPRQTYEELIGQDRMPDWLDGSPRHATPKRARGAA